MRKGWREMYVQSKRMNQPKRHTYTDHKLNDVRSREVTGSLSQQPQTCLGFLLTQHSSVQTNA